MSSSSISLPTPSLPETATLVTTGPKIDQLLGALDTAGQAAVRQGLSAMAQVPEGPPGATGAVMTGDSPAMDNQAALQPNGSVSPPVKMLQTVSLADIQGAATFIGKAELAAIDPQAVSLSDLQYAAKDLTPTALKIASASLAAKPGGNALAPGAMQAAKDGLAGVAVMTKDAQAAGTSNRMGLSPAAAPDANSDAVIEQTTNDTAALVDSIKAGVPGATAQTDKIALDAASVAAAASAKASLADGTSQTIEEAAAQWQKAFVDTYDAWLKILSPPPPSGLGTGYHHVQIGNPSNNAPGGTTQSSTHTGGADGDSGPLEDKHHYHHAGHHNNGHHNDEHHSNSGLGGTSPYTLPATTWNGTTTDPLSGLIPPRQGDPDDLDALSPPQYYPTFPAIPANTDQYGVGQFGTVPYAGADGLGYGTDTSQLTPAQAEQARQEQAAALQAYEKQQAYEEELRQAQLQAFLNTMNEAYNTASTLASGATGAAKPDFRWQTTAMEAETVRRQVLVQNEEERRHEA